jgi:hypothetical protein
VRSRVSHGSRHLLALNLCGQSIKRQITGGEVKQRHARGLAHRPVCIIQSFHQDRQNLAVAGPSEIHRRFPANRGVLT